MGVRAQQKERTRRSLIEAAFNQLSAERSFASLSLRRFRVRRGSRPRRFIAIFVMWMSWDSPWWTKAA